MKLLNRITNLRNPLKPLLVLCGVIGCLLFTNCTHSNITQYRSISNYCDDKYYVGTKVWVRNWYGGIKSMESWQLDEVCRVDVEKTLKIQMDSALKVKTKIDECLNNR